MQHLPLHKCKLATSLRRACRNLKTKLKVAKIDLRLRYLRAILRLTYRKLASCCRKLRKLVSCYRKLRKLAGHYQNLRKLAASLRVTILYRKLRKLAGHYQNVCKRVATENSAACGLAGHYQNHRKLAGHCQNTPQACRKLAG